MLGRGSCCSRYPPSHDHVGGLNVFIDAYEQIRTSLSILGSNHLTRLSRKLHCAKEKQSKGNPAVPTTFQEEKKLHSPFMRASLVVMPSRLKMHCNYSGKKRITGQSSLSNSESQQGFRPILHPQLCLNVNALTNPDTTVF
ncbi:hypothetical protein Pelo_2809 [Pelomyxa schiedti]|nr:hypothetical protein Pelo_2809 [Pelomyxa schiedti]